MGNWRFTVALLALLLNACGPVTPPAGEIAEPASTRTAVPTDEAPPASSEPGRAPDGWQMHTSGQWAVSFSVPAAWQEVGTDNFEGKDGFARLEAFTGPGVSVDQACEWEANYHHERYGLAPALNSLSRDNLIDAKGQPCLIHSADEGSAIVLPNPKPVSGETPFLLLSVDREHFQGVAQSLDYRLEVGPAPTLSDSSFGRTLSPEEVPDNLPLESRTFGDLTLEEYTIIDANADGPGYFEFSQRIPPAVLAKRRAWRGKQPARNHLDPIQVDGKPIAATYADYGGVPVTGGMMYSTAVSVQSDGQEIYRYNMSSAHAGTFPLYYLGNWNGRWVLEANGMLIVDGQIVNQEWGYDEIFGCQELSGRPFYFFVQDGQTRLSYGGETLPVSYDYVYHGMCCEPAAFNAGGNDQMVWFYALKDGAWHYVELGVYR
jgi:hypothetical protein